jgi:hypothetical protein
MKIEEIKKNAFSMPLTSPAYPRGPYRFVNREFMIITYETDMDALREVVPEPLKVTEPNGTFAHLVRRNKIRHAPCHRMPELPMVGNLQPPETPLLQKPTSTSSMRLKILKYRTGTFYDLN